MTNYRKFFGRNLKKLRKTAQMTQDDLAATTGLSLQYISEVERGIANPKLDTILRLAYGLGIPPIELFYLHDTSGSPSVRRRKLAAALTLLDEHSIDIIYRLLLLTVSSYQHLEAFQSDTKPDLDL